MASRREQLMAMSQKNFENQKQTLNQPTVVTDVVKNLNAMENSTANKPVSIEADNVQPQVLHTEESSEKKHVGPETVKSDTQYTTKINLYTKKKEYRSERKCFLITPTLNRRLAATAKEYGVSENDVINNILNQVFNVE